MAEDDLKPLEIDDGISLFLGHKEREVTTQTIGGYETSLNHFKKYCDREGISDLNDLTGRNLEQYRIWRREESTDDTLAPKTMRDEMYLIRDFVRYLESIEAIGNRLSEKVVVPKLAPGDGVRDVQLERDRARRILDHLEKFSYASLEHVVWVLLCETAPFNPRKASSSWFDGPLDVVHRSSEDDLPKLAVPDTRRDGIEDRALYRGIHAFCQRSLIIPLRL